MDTSANIFKPIGVVTAIAFESDAIISQFDPGTAQEMSDDRLPNGMKLYRGRIGKREIYLLEAGAGKICAAMGTQVLLLIEDDISAVYNIGIAGSLDHTLQIRDIIIADKTAQHDMVGNPKNGRANGIIPLHSAEDSHPGTAPELLAALVETCEQLHYPVHVGTILSGDMPVFDDAVKERLVQAFAELNPIAVDMESASVAFVAAKNNIPCAIIRVISDSASSNDTPLTLRPSDAGSIVEVAAAVFAEHIRTLQVN